MEGTELFNLLVSFNGWNGRRDTMPIERTFEYTDEHVRVMYTNEAGRDHQSAATLPTLFMSEDRWDADPIARVGTIQSVVRNGVNLAISYQFDPRIPGIPNSRLRELAPELGIENFEFSRTHWAIKDVDLFHALLSNPAPVRLRPSVFTLREPAAVQRNLVSMMMPFDPQYNDVFDAVQAAAAERGLECLRADNIWENPAIIQDVVSLIDRSRLVVCDCSGRNPNVFYEMGIAHTLGREVVPIAQARADVPFDVQHLRYIHYLNNNEGRLNLVRQLAPKFDALRE